MSDLSQTPSASTAADAPAGGVSLPTRNFRGTQVTEVGLGCWQLGGGEGSGDFGPMSDDDAAAILKAAYESGVRFFDTAEVYGSGRSESRIGNFLGSLVNTARREIRVVTKLARNHAEGDVYKNVREATEASLGRLGLPELLATQLHCWSNPSKEAFEAVLRLKEDGLIRHAAASVESVAEGMEAIDHGMESLQIIFSAFRQRPLVEGLLDRAEKENVAILVRLPLASGLLAGAFGKGGKYQSHADLPEGDHRRSNKDGEHFNVGETLAGLTLEDGIAAADKALPILKSAAPEGTPVAQAALRWCLDHPAVTAVIPGATSPKQARSNAAAAKLAPLGDDAHAKLREVWQNDVDPKVRGKQ